MKQRAGREQVALVQHALRQHIRVHPGIHPAKQAGRLGHEAAARVQRQLHAARAGLGQPQAHAFGVAAQLPLLDAQRQRFFQDGRRGQGRQQLGVEQALGQIRRRRQVTHTPAGRQDLGETADIDGAAQTVQRTETGGMVGRNVAVGVVLDDVEVVPLRQLQQLVRAPWRQAVARGVVQHAHAHKQPGRMHLAVARHHFQVGPFGPARHRQHPHAQGGKPGKLHRPARLFDHHRVARLEQRAAHDVQRMRGAHGGHDLGRACRYIQVTQAARQRLAQTGVTQGLAIAEGALLQRTARRHLAHRCQHKTGLFQPDTGKHPRTRLRQAGPLVEHAPDQRRGVDVRARGQGPRCLAQQPSFICYIFNSCLRFTNGR